MNEKNTKEFRFKFGNNILNYIYKFSATEKVVFGIFTILFIVSGIILANKALNLFKIDIPKYSGTIDEGIIGLPRLINPVLATSEADKDISALVFSGLTKYENGKITNDLAKNSSVSDDGLVYDFVLRDDIVFHDNTKLTADDIVFTIQKIQDPAIKSPKRADWQNITVKKINDHEVQFSLKQPYSPFITITTVGILPKHIWSNVSDEEFVFSNINTKPIGTGPFMYGNAIINKGGIPTEYRLIRNEKYYDKKAYLSEINFHFYDTEKSLVTDLINENIDSASDLTNESVKTIKKSTDNTKFVESIMPRIFGLFINTSQSELLSDLDTRTAMSLVIDRDEIIQQVFGGDAISINGPLPKMSSGTSSIPNLQLANKILEKDGWKKNENGIYEKKIKNILTELSFNLYTSDDTDFKKVSEIVAKQYLSFGIKVNVKIFDENELYNNIIRTRKFDVLLFGEHIGRSEDLYAFWHSSQRIAPGLNISMYVNNKVDKILESIRAENVEEKKIKLYNDLESIISSDIPAIFLYSPKYIYAIPKELNGLEIIKLTVPSERFYNVTSWYTETQRVLKLFKQN